MTRVRIGLGALAILLAAAINNHAAAQQISPYTANRSVAANPAAYSGQGAPLPNPHLYPRLNAPLYPAPVQGVPTWTGGAVITNQALAPHEMLYAHQYRALYPPFYYHVKGHWLLGAMGVKQAELWKLEGTEVKVKYRSHSGLFSRLHLIPRW
jgi:hypothetical protein